MANQVLQINISCNSSIMRHSTLKHAQDVTDFKFTDVQSKYPETVLNDIKTRNVPYNRYFVNVKA